MGDLERVCHNANLICTLLLTSSLSQGREYFAGVQHARGARRFWDGVYVLYTYTAKRSTSQGVQKLLSKPAIGGDTSNILRHMTFVR